MASCTCMKCGQRFCRECVKKARTSHYCPDCQKAEIDRLASQICGEKARPKKEPVAREKKLKKPVEKPVGPPVPVSRPAAPPEPEVEPSVSPEEKAAFWGGKKQPRRAARRLGRETAAPLKTEGLPPPMQAPPVSGGAAHAPQVPEKVPPVVPETKKRRLMPEAERRESVMAQEGFPMAEEAEEEAAPRKVKSPRVKRVRRPRREAPVAMQMPDEYDGELTPEPSYLKAVLWALLAGAIGAGAYAGFAWWRHREFGIFGWVIGAAVGLAVVFGSGRHFSWQLGLVAAAIAMFFVSAGRILVYMMSIWFPDVIKLPVPTMENFNQAINQYVRQFPTTWLVFLLVAGLVAFLLSFRPWPIKLQASGEAGSGRVAKRRA